MTGFQVFGESLSALVLFTVLFVATFSVLVYSEKGCFHLLA